MSSFEEYHAAIAKRNAKLQALADTMKSYSDTHGDHHWQAALEIERLLMIENLYLVSGRCFGDTNDTVELVEGLDIQPFLDQLTVEDGSQVHVVYQKRLADAVDYRLRKYDAN